MTPENEAQKRENILMGLYKLHAYIPFDSVGNTLTPFGNFVKGYNAAKADSEQKIAELEALNSAITDSCNLNHRLASEFAEKNTELQAHINKLREAFCILYPALVLDLSYADIENDDLEALQSRIDTIREALAETPAQSLKAHDDELIEQCASIAASMMIPPSLEGAAIANEIRRLKKP